MREGQQACVVCCDIANGVHFGAITCEGCKVGDELVPVRRPVMLIKKQLS